MLSSVQSLPGSCFLLALALAMCSLEGASAQVTLPNQSYVLPTTLEVSLRSGVFDSTDIFPAFSTDVYAVISLAGNTDRTTPIVEDDSTPLWTPIYTTTFDYDIATNGYVQAVTFAFWDDDDGAVFETDPDGLPEYDDDDLGSRAIDFTFDQAGNPQLFAGFLLEYGIPEHSYEGGLQTRFTAGMRADALRVQLDSGESWNTGSNQLKVIEPTILSRTVFKEVTINNGGTLTAPGGVLMDNQGAVTINSGGLLTSPGIVWILGNSSLNLNFGGTLQVGALATDPGALHWNSGTLEFLEGYSVSSTNPFNLTDLSISVGRTLKINGELEIVSGGALIVDNGTLDTRDNVDVDGGYLSANPSASGLLGRFDVAPGKTVTFRNNGVGVFTGNSTYDNGKTLNILSGGDVKFGGKLELRNATLLVDGANSELTTNNTDSGSQFWGAGGGATNATFSNGAQGFLKSGLALGTSGVAGTIGNLNVESDADVTLNSHMQVAAGSAGAGTLTVTGAGSTLTLDGDFQLTVGATVGSVGRVHVNDSGILRSGVSTTFINPTGAIDIDGGTLHARGNMSIDGGALTLSAGSLTVNAGKFVTFTNNGQGNFSSPQNFSNGQTLEVFSGSDLVVNGSLLLGISGNGAIVVDGVGSTLTTDSPMTWGANSGSASATFRNGAQGNLNDQLLMAGAAANLNVESNAMVTARSIRLAPHSNGSAALTIAGSGSTLVQAAASTLTVGGTGSSMGTININDGGTLQTGAGATTINPTGTVNVGAGMLRAMGDVNIDGGAVTMSHVDSRLDAGTIRLNSGSFAFNNGELGVDRFEGNLVNSGGRLSPGRLEPGQETRLTTITGDYAAGGGSLVIELGGSIRGAEYDAVSVEGDVVLNSSLSVSLTGGFQLTPGQTFEILNVAGAFSGAFAGLAERGLVGVFGNESLWISYAGGDGNDVVLFTETGVTADFDNDFDVDGADFLKWQRGLSPSPLSVSDFAAWRQHYGNDATPTNSTNVPEPAACIAWLLGMASFRFVGRYANVDAVLRSSSRL